MKVLTTVLILSIILGASCVSLRKKAHALSDQIVYQSGFNKLSPANTAQDISVGADGTMYMIGTTSGGTGGNEIRKWNEANKNWDSSIGNGVRIAVDPQGLPWITNDAEEVWANTGAQWSKVGVRSTDIGASANGYITVVGGSAEHSLWRNVNGAVEIWWPLWGQTAGSVAGDPQGNPWITGYTDNFVYKWTGSEWSVVSGAKATDIGVGADGTVWIVSDKPAASGGNQVAILNAATGKWSFIPQVGATRVSVYPNGDLAAVDNEGGVFRLSKPKLKGR